MAGAPFDETVDLFTKSGSSWSEVSKIRPSDNPDGAIEFEYGFNVKMDATSAPLLSVLLWWTHRLIQSWTQQTTKTPAWYIPTICLNRRQSFCFGITALDFACLHMYFIYYSLYIKRLRTVIDLAHGIQRNRPLVGTVG